MDWEHGHDTRTAAATSTAAAMSGAPTIATPADPNKATSSEQHYCCTAVWKKTREKNMDTKNDPAGRAIALYGAPRTAGW